MTVTRTQLETCLDELTRHAHDPRAGLFGPSSMSWQVNREMSAFAAAGRAVMLQLAHPYIAHAIEHHSPTRDDPKGRFVRTLSKVFALIFGDLDSAVTTAREVHTIHASIEGKITEGSGRFAAGTPYAANEEHALLWVYATLLDSVVKAYEVFVGPLSDAQLERYYEESCLFAYLFGLKRAQLPDSWQDFQRYFERTVGSDDIAVCSYGRDMSFFLLEPPSLLWQPVVASYRLLTTALLPDKLRGQFGLPWGRTERLAYRASLPLMRGSYAALPERVRYFPAYMDARRRMQGKGPDVASRWLEQLALRTLPHSS